MIQDFYEKFIIEASSGRIAPDDSMFVYNISFNTLIEEDNKYIAFNNEKFNDINLIIPTLKISNKKLFNKLLIEYVETYKKYIEENHIENEHTDMGIIATLFSNATYEDFENPILFLQKQIGFLNDKSINKLNFTFFSNELNSFINIKNVPSKSYNETPFHIETTIKKDDSTYNLPNIYYGIYNDIAYIYAIQNIKQQSNDDYSKKIKRLLYKVNANFNKNDNYENYEEGNLKDITPSFLLAINIFFSVLSSKNISKVNVPSILIERWNAKEIANIYKFKNRNKLEEYQSQKEFHNVLQNNLTEKLIRHFNRLASQNFNVEIQSYPNELDSSLHLLINKNKQINNDLLKDTYNEGRKI